ncbi:pectinesterase family protein [Paenibacillus sp.]|uniref:pectinesterase family protein n=1 Tax=Paenibacillus sp. TaxID=58172 RepID=UPI002811064F|nr:pectinesterase family protein [Paenibacillus sp.]
MIVVAADGSGDFPTIGAAVDSLPATSDPATIVVRPGLYREKLFVTRPKVRLLGSGAERTVVAYDDYALKTFPNGEPYHTFHSYTAYFGGDDFLAEDLTFANTAGPGEKVGQAIAVYADGDRAIFRRCRIVGAQDTLFTGPLPPAPAGRAAFGGPGDVFPRRHVRQYYRDCYIEGDVDYIFGSATAVFRGCELFSRRRASSDAASGAPNGWIAAPSTPREAEYGYVFLDCALTGDAPPGSVFLGRPWREDAAAAFVGCRMNEAIAPAGWDNWGKPEREATVRFLEVGGIGPGADPSRRVPWARRLDAAEAARFAPGRVLAGGDGWNPEA